MPCLELTLPECDKAVKAALAESLTAAFAGSTGHSREIFHIAFHELRPGQSAVAGALDAGPYLHLLLYCPRLSREQKQALVRGFSGAVREHFGKDPILHIVEHPYDDVGVNGQLLSDLFPELRGRKFYYPME